jgi:hypothetical protein
MVPPCCCLFLKEVPPAAAMTRVVKVERAAEVAEGATLYQ